MRASLALLPLLAAACRTPEGPAGDLPPDCVLVHAHPPWPEVDLDGVRHFSVPQVVTDGGDVAVLVGTSAVLFTEGEEYALSGLSVARSTDGAASFDTVDVDVPGASSVHLHDGRLYALQKATGDPHDSYAVREILPDGTGGPAIGGGPVPAVGRLSVAGARVSSLGGWRGRLTWGEVDLDAGTAVARIDEETPFGGHLPFRSLDGGATWHALWEEDDPPRICHARARPREVAAAEATPWEVTCDGVVRWPHGDRSLSFDVPVRTAAGDLRVYERDGHVYASPYDEAAPRRELHLGPGRVDWRTHGPFGPLLPGLIGIGSEDGIRYVYVDRQERLLEVDLPPSSCAPCYGVETLLAVRPLDPEVRDLERQPVLVLTQVDLGEPGSRQFNVCARTEVLTMRPAHIPPPPVARWGDFPGCDAPPYPAGDLDAACALRNACFPATYSMTSCVEELMRVEPARAAAFAAARTCEDDALWGTLPVETWTGACEADACDGDLVVRCRDRQRDDCALLGLTCDEGTAPGGAAPTCTPNAGCGFDPAAARRGVCQGDLLVYEVHGGTRHVDCAALGLGTCQPTYFPHCGRG